MDSSTLYAVDSRPSTPSSPRAQLAQSQKLKVPPHLNLSIPEATPRMYLTPSTPMTPRIWPTTPSRRTPSPSSGLSSPLTKVFPQRHSPDRFFRPDQITTQLPTSPNGHLMPAPPFGESDTNDTEETHEVYRLDKSEATMVNLVCEVGESVQEEPSLILSDDDDLEDDVDDEDTERRRRRQAKKKLAAKLGGVTERHSVWLEQLQEPPSGDLEDLRIGAGISEEG